MSSQRKRKCVSNKNDELPQGWVVGFSSTHRKNYYFNSITGVSTWIRPGESSCRERSSVKPQADKTCEPLVIKKPQETLQNPSPLPERSTQGNSKKKNLDRINDLSLANHVGMKVKFSVKQQAPLKKPADVFNLSHNRNEKDSPGGGKFHEVVFGKVTKRKKSQTKRKSLEVSLSANTEIQEKNNNKAHFSINSSNDTGFNNSLSDPASNVRGCNFLQKEKNPTIGKGKTGMDPHLKYERTSTSNLMHKKDLRSQCDKSSSWSYPEVTRNRTNLSQDELIRRYNKTHPIKICQLEREDAYHPTTSKMHNSCIASDRHYKGKKSVTQTSKSGSLPSIHLSRVVSRNSFNKSVGSSSSVDVNICRSTPVAKEKEEIDMEWEAIEDEKVLLDIQEHRQQFQRMRSSNFDSPPEDMEVNYFDLSSSENKECVIVLDTNILISHRKFVEQLSEKEHKGLGRPTLVIPWMVLKELDSLKGNRSNLSSYDPRLQYNARSAIQFINHCFNAHHPCIKGQSAMDDKEECFKVEIPDDSILNCCLQLLNKGKKAILLSNDVNLCNKALANGIQSYGKEQVNNAIINGDLKQLFLPQCSAINERNYQVLDTAVETQLPKVPGKQYEVPTSQILYSKFKTLLHQFLSKLLEAEMKRVFEEMWMKVVYLKPPWSLLDILRCMSKHWCAVFSHIMDSMAKNTIEKLLNTFRRPLSGPTMKEIESMVESGIDLCRTMTSKEYRDLVSEYKHYFEALLRNDQDNLQNIKPVVLEQCTSFSVPTNPADESGKNIVFEAFQMTLSLVNNFCGILCDTLGVNHGIIYQKPEVFPSVEEMKEKLPNVSKCIDNLTNSMCCVLETPVSCLSPQHPALFSLHASLQAVIPSDCPLFCALTCERLLSFVVEDNTRVMLSNGRNQFTEFQMLLSKLISCIVER